MFFAAILLILLVGFYIFYCPLTDDVTNTTSNPPVDQPKDMESYSAAESKWLLIVTII